MTRVNWDSLMLQYLFLDGVPFFVANLFSLFGVGIAMFLLNWKLCLMVFIPVPLIILATKGFLPKLWKLLSRRFRKRRFMNALINDALTGARVVKSFGKENEEIQRFGPANFGVFSSNMASIRYRFTVFPLLLLLIRTGGLIVWALGGLRVIQGDISFGVLMSFIGYIALIY